MNDTYYAIQVFGADRYSQSLADEKWASIIKASTLKEASELFHKLSMDTDSPVRLVRAFISEFSGEERVREILSFRKDRRPKP